MGTTPVFGIPELVQGQATPHTTFNIALALLAVMQGGVVDRAVNTPAVSPAEGDAYIIGAAPTGAWTGRANSIAVYYGAQWRFLPGNDDNDTAITIGTSHEGFRVYVKDEDLLYVWSGSAWTAATPVIVAGHAAVSVVGRAANSSGDVADIAAAANDRLFARTSDTLAFQQLTNGMVPTNTVGLDKLANAGAQYDIVGRKTSSGGAWEDCTRTQLLLAGTDLANTFTGGLQVINKNSQSAPSPTFNSLFQINGEDSQFPGFHVDAYGSRLIWAVRRANGTQATKTALANGDNLFQWIIYGYDGSSYIQGGAGQFGTTEAWGANRGCRWTFTGTLAGTTSPGTGVSIGAGICTGGAGDPGNNNAYFTGTIRCGSFTVGTLPAAATAGAGASAYVTDANAPAFGAAVAGGGAVGMVVFSTGAAWNVG